MKTKFFSLIIFTVCVSINISAIAQEGFTNNEEAKNQYKDSLKEGKWIEYADAWFNPTIKDSAMYYSLTIYKAGKQQGLVRYYSIKYQKLETAIPYADGKRNGEMKVYSNTDESQQSGSQNPPKQSWERKTHISIGVTCGTMNSNQSIASGVSIFLGRDIVNTKNSSFSICTNIKVGTEDKTGLVLLTKLLEIFSTTSRSDNYQEPVVNAFAEFPLLLHYNFGLGSEQHTDIENANHKFGFYFGGGINYMLTGYTDTSGNSEGTSFYGIMADGGIRFNHAIDINIATTFPLERPIGQMSNPKFFEMTLSIFY